MVFCTKIWKISRDARASWWWQNLEGAPLMQPWSILKRSGVVAECECVTLCNPGISQGLFSFHGKSTSKNQGCLSPAAPSRTEPVMRIRAFTRTEWGEAVGLWRKSFMGTFKLHRVCLGEKMTGNSQETLNILPIITEVSRKSPRKPILGVLQSSWISAWKTHWEDWRSRESPEHYENPAGWS